MSLATNASFFSEHIKGISKLNKKLKPSRTLKVAFSYTLSETWSGVNWADVMAAQGAFGPIFMTGLPER